MNRLPAACVIDASVLIQLFLEEAHTSVVRAYIGLFAQKPPSVKLQVPDLLFVECANILWKQVQRAEYPPDQAQRDLTDLYTLRLPATPTSELMKSALDIACTYGTSAYDACYVALADQLAVPLLTQDLRLAQQLAQSPYRILTLDALLEGEAMSG